MSRLRAAWLTTANFRRLHRRGFCGCWISRGLRRRNRRGQGVFRHNVTAARYDATATVAMAAARWGEGRAARIGTTATTASHRSTTRGPAANWSAAAHATVTPSATAQQTAVRRPAAAAAATTAASAAPAATHVARQEAAENGHFAAVQKDQRTAAAAAATAAAGVAVGLDRHRIAARTVGHGDVVPPAVHRGGANDGVRRSVVAAQIGVGDLCRGNDRQHD